METVINYITELEQMMREISLPHLERVLQLLERAYHDGHRIFIMLLLSSGECRAAGWLLSYG